jgi:hypothetical protein
MAQQLITHTAPVRGVVPHPAESQPVGSVTGYQSNGPEVRADAGKPNPAQPGGAAGIRAPFTADMQPLAKPPAAPRSRGQERPEQPEDESPAGPGRDPWSYSVRVEGPAYGGAVWNGGGGSLANTISGTAPRAIESGAAKTILDVAEDVL